MGTAADGQSKDLEKWMAYIRDPAFKPKALGRIRKEVWGGLSYNRTKLRLDLLNDTAFSVLSRCDGTRTLIDIQQALASEFDVPAEKLADDIRGYMGYALSHGYVAGKETESAEKSTTPDMFNYDLERMHQSDDASFLIGDKVLGTDPNVLSAPIKVLIEFTHNCNLRCVHCFADADYCAGNSLGYLPGELTADQWGVVISKLAKAGVFDIFVSGGEPLLRKDIFEIMAHIKASGMGFCLLTNATLIDDAIARKMTDLGCYKVEANLDGPDAASYDEFRGVKGSFEQTVQGIQAAMRNGIRVRCNLTATKKNIYTLKDTIRTAWKIGVRELCAVPLEPGGRGHSNASDLDISMEEHMRLRSFYGEVAAWVESEYGKEFAFVAPTDLLVDNRENPVVDFIDPNRMMPMCGAGRYHCSIEPTGHVILCPSAGKAIKITPGDVLNEDFEMIWREGDVFKQVRRSDVPGCANCEYTNCGGGCHVRAYHKYGRVGVGPDPDCRKVLFKKFGTEVSRP